ncbi:CTP synthase [Methanohalobium evestigatum Z-7303]|uniref:CTP synthase n=1 Tax=Methanohalobium evestigatum (strain ATCC BAA-1072 / DSM 3721 / NBRC 107634 / OCM 161 / Z-7303) TaxID=644295 RepID=D7E6J4_METEZ|nr:CTP synthase (glutamine hydrolyzing) [Methanohalobium evestigatum]ADI73216.1 CTP synthase [Methanohalobium evestigatum Z-7303]
MKYIVVTGGVMSGLGKGITTASIGRNLKNKGYRVTAIKIDPYINIDAGTMSPYQHGEVYVLKDGGEVDLDLGNYERFLDTELTHDHNITTGKFYNSVISKERRGEYLGKTVQIIPHVTNEIKDWIRDVASDSGADICLIEVGGTIGDIESMPFLEALRQMHREEPEENTIFVHVTLVPLDAQGEQKTKPTQHSTRDMRELGLTPNVVVARCEEPLLESTISKISLFSDVPEEAVISANDVEDIYEVPLMLEKEGLTNYLMKMLDLKKITEDTSWNEMVSKMKSITGEVKFAIIGKYTHLGDSYISIREALKHAAIESGCNFKSTWIDAELINRDSDALENLSEYDGILVPGGFGERGIEGKIKAIQYAREHDIPYLGLCLGMQLSVIEFARNVAGLENANSTEFDPSTPHPVIDILPEQKDLVNMGATMRLGTYKACLKQGTLAQQIYSADEIVERHRHRYEVNPEYIEKIEKHGMIFSAMNNGKRMEIAEIPEKKFFFTSQFHPEFTSRPGHPSPPFKAFIEAMMDNK